MLDSVVCVYRSGGDFDHYDVNRLHRQVRKHLSGDYRFYCLTDDVNQHYSPGISVLRTWSPYPKWWGKVDMWHPKLAEMFGRAFYLDLDTLVIGPLDAIAAYDGAKPLVTADWYHGGPSQSLLIYDTNQFIGIWNKFQADPHKWMSQGDKMECPNWGDQLLLREQCNIEFNYFQDFFPGKLASYKVTLKCKEPPSGHDFSIICFHGKPRPKDAELWVKRLM